VTGKTSCNNTNNKPFFRTSSQQGHITALPPGPAQPRVNWPHRKSLSYKVAHQISHDPSNASTVVLLRRHTDGSRAFYRMTTPNRRHKRHVTPHSRQLLPDSRTSVRGLLACVSSPGYPENRLRSRRVSVCIVRTGRCQKYDYDARVTWNSIYVDLLAREEFMTSYQPDKAGISSGQAPYFSSIEATIWSSDR
jgi:hypothetical protein